MFCLFLFIKIAMASEIYYVFPHITQTTHKATLVVFFILTLITLVAATNSKPLYLQSQSQSSE